MQNCMAELEPIQDSIQDFLDVPKWWLPDMLRPPPGI